MAGFVAGMDRGQSTLLPDASMTGSTRTILFV